MYIKSQISTTKVDIELYKDYILELLTLVEETYVGDVFYNDNILALKKHFMWCVNKCNRQLKIALNEENIKYFWNLLYVNFYTKADKKLNMTNLVEFYTVLFNVDVKKNKTLYLELKKIISNFVTEKEST